MSEFTKESLSKLKCNELSAMCRQRKLPVSGAKSVLIARLLGEAIPVSKSKRAAGLRAVPINKALDVALSHRVAIVLDKNAYGNYEHKETGFVFDKESKKVIGKQIGNSLVNLNMTDLNTCKEYNFNVDDTRVDKKFSVEQESSRLKELLKHVEESDNEDDET